MGSEKIASWSCQTLHVCRCFVLSTETASVGEVSRQTRITNDLDVSGLKLSLVFYLKRLTLKKKSRIRETKQLSTDADSSTDAIGRWTKAKSATKKNFFLRGDFRPLPNKNVQMLDHFFPLRFPKGSEYLKILDIRLWEVGAKRPVKGTSKVKK